MTSEAAPTSTCPSDPLLVNGKKLTFSEPSRSSLKEGKETPKEEKDGEDAADEKGDEAEGGDDKKAPKLRTVLKNFRPPSLAKFVPKATKGATSPGCDV